MRILTQTFSNSWQEFFRGIHLAPYLFTMDYTIHEAVEGEREDLGFKLARCCHHKPTITTSIDYIDDIFLITE